MSRWPETSRNSGPRLPRSVTSEERYQRSLDAPATSEHCWACGSPPSPENPLNLFELRLGGRYAGHWQLCDGCHRYRVPPPVAVDPLDVTEVA